MFAPTMYPLTSKLILMNLPYKEIEALTGEKVTDIRHNQESSALQI